MSGRKQTDQGSLSPSDCRKAYRAERKAVTLYHLLGKYLIFFKINIVA